jgi:hypothetical protein
MTTTARANLWHALRLELGQAVAEHLSVENDPTSPPVLRRLDIARRSARARLA